jgi:preprotein translocase subunit YajC
MEIALVYFALLVIAFFVLVVRPQRRRLAAHRAFLSTLRLGDEVITSGGVYGTIRALRDEAVELEIAPDTVIRVARAAIAQPAPVPPQLAVEDADPDPPAP